MNDRQLISRWFPFHTYALDDERCPVVLCFHHAGGSAAYYRDWTRKKCGLNFLCTELPGKGTRMNEEFLNEFDKMKPGLCETIHHLAGKRKYYIFGHSMGAAIGFYVAEYMSRVYGQPPAKLIVAGRQAPDVEAEDEFKSYMSDEALIEELKKYDATPKEILESKELLDYFLPTVRRDYELNDSIQYHGEKLSIPITAHAGREDHGAEPHIMKEWRRMTTGAFKIKEFDGSHFFVFPDDDRYFEEIVKEIQSTESK